MGIWDWCSSSYGFGLAAVTKINNVRMNATQTLFQSLSDEETQSRFGQEAADLAKTATVYGCQEVLKLIPGGTLIYRIVSRSISGKNNSSKKPRRKRRQSAQAKLEESDDEKSEDLESAEKDEPCANLKCHGVETEALAPRRKCRQRAQAKAAKLEESDDEKSEDLERVEKGDPCAALKTQSTTYLKSKL